MTIAQTEAQATAEADWRAVIDAQQDDLDLLLERWPDRTSPDVVAAIDRLAERTVPGGLADQAAAAVHAAYGGRDRTPPAVRLRMEQYVWDVLGGPRRPPNPALERALENLHRLPNPQWEAARERAKHKFAPPAEAPRPALRRPEVGRDFTDEDLRRRPKYRGGRRVQQEDADVR